MLEELRVENFAVIDQLELRFGAGFQVITGETGAGKSILIDAVELLLGGRADPTFVRAGSQRSIIEGVIRLDERARQALLPALQREELIDPDAPDYLTIRREIRRRGRSSARINGVPVRSDLLTEIGGELFDIHGQSQHLSLFRPRRHIDLLDRYAGLLATRAGLADLVADLAALQAEMRALADGSEALARRADMLRHELDEIQAANLDPAEEDELQKERNRLANSEQLAQLAGEAARLLDDNDDDRGAVDKLMGVAGTLLKLTQIDPQLSEQYDQAESLAQAAQELALELARYAGDAEYDPQRLNELEERLELIRNLKRRHNVDTVQDILDYARRAQTELDSIDHSDERLQALGAREERLLRQIGDISWRLSQARAQAGDDLSAAVVRELSDLRMERTRFDVRLAQAEHPAGCIVGETRYKFDAKGLDDVEFLLSANPGEPLRPLAKVASGGEAARIMLALKRVLTAADHTPILIFDEVDQGIGGRLGAVVGEKLWSLSSAHQVLCVTHLPQLASFADAHFQAQKDLQSAHAATQVRQLTDDDERVSELASMLGAGGLAGLLSARDMLDAARRVKGE
ncbi:MAG: DNA repair protein RecN [Chloroflexi bacterium]|nr:DNA repair protein RecN [Chloroflexota bacterium]MCY3583358.1 DNA repair protein RecN [Chloroflexota bacterium]MCY3717879.1 DNA repair protein RecN [Chloroflexota bacterium]MDE2650375.1 DNA repair protein RecN [Chloroflexota bacterium]MYC54945.1 DNA repair protein RecN [Chloroflexota bacterium]